MNLSRLASDYESLGHNEFWLMYRTRIDSYSKLMLDSLKSAPIESVSRIQGELKALDFVSSLPALLAATLENDIKL